MPRASSRPNNPAVATVAGGIVTPVAAGAATITAAQPGDTNFNSATSINLTLTVLEGAAFLLGWELNGLTNLGPSPLAPTQTSLRATSGGLVRGPGVTAVSTPLIGWGATGFVSASPAAAIAAGQYVSFNVQASGYAVSLQSLQPYQAPMRAQWQYSVDGTNFTNVGGALFLAFAQYPLLDLASVPALQNVPTSTPVTLHCVFWSGSASDATGAISFFNYAGAPGFDLLVTGSVVPFELKLVQAATATFDSGSGNTTKSVDFAAQPNQNVIVEYATTLAGPWTAANGGTLVSTAAGSLNVVLSAPGDITSAWNRAMYFRGRRP